MRKNCKLIATIPSINNMDKVRKIISSPMVSEVRFNTGAQSPYSPKDTIQMLLELANLYQKKLWVDIKGRQLRVTKWANPLYSCIEINHKVKVLQPAKVLFRNGDTVNLTHVVDGNKLFVDPLPKSALGAGQSINILSKNLQIEGYLADKDKEYLEACKELGVNDILASYVESFTDFTSILAILPSAKITSKIESMNGIEFISNFKIPNLMAARDDLYTEVGQSYCVLRYLKLIIDIDKDAICASKIFTSLESRENVDLADFADLELMYEMGYRNFMLCDNVCNYSFDKAILAWEEFING